MTQTGQGEETAEGDKYSEPRGSKSRLSFLAIRKCVGAVFGYILDGLLMNPTGKRIKEQYADTGGFTIIGQGTG